MGVRNPFLNDLKALIKTEITSTLPKDFGDEDVLSPRGSSRPTSAMSRRGAGPELENKIMQVLKSTKLVTALP